MMDNSIEKINRHSSFERAKEILSGKDVVLQRSVPDDAYVPDGGHLGAWPNVEAVQFVGKSTSGEFLSQQAPEDIEYEVDIFDPPPKPTYKNPDSRNSGKKRDKAKAKAQKKARKLTRRK